MTELHQVDRIGQERERPRGDGRRRSASLGSYQAAVDAALAEMAEQRIMARIWSQDHTVWKPDPTEIANRLGWLRSPEAMRAQIPRMNALVESVRKAGTSDVLLLGMGGSSLAPEVLGRVFGGAVAHALNVSVLDSTDPGAVRACAERLAPTRTLFIVSTKSGGTVETLSFFKFFYNWTADALGEDRAGEHFVAITDPGSRLVDLATRYQFRDIFLNDPNIGGRYSALSYFGLVPAALAGVDVETLLVRALAMARDCEACNGPVKGDNDGAWLGAVLGELAKAGRDKVTIITSRALANFGDWVEQLIAESTGKDGQGILPVVGEPMGAPGVYGDDRLFVYLQVDGDGTYDDAVQALEDAGQPVVRLRLRDAYDLGQQFFLWEMATAVAGYRLGIQPFSQPNVDAAKTLAQQAVANYKATGRLPADEPAPLAGAALEEFLNRAETPVPGASSRRAYVALQAFVQPTDESDAALAAMRSALRARLRLATTAGYGPRFLHSTGQLHKGDAGHGLFIQFTSDAEEDLAIPDEAGAGASSVTFGVLKMAQALGDKRALQDAGRRMIRFHLGTDVLAGLSKLLAAV